MKKLLFPFFLALCGMAVAQSVQTRHSLSLVAGPNWMDQSYYDNVVDFPSQPRTGLSIGADYAFDVATHWQVIASFRYNLWNWKNCKFFLFEDDIINGRPGTWMCYNFQDKTLHYLLGARWQSKPKIWRWYGGVEVGMTERIDPQSTLENAFRLTVGANAGVEWQPGRFGLFSQPAFRYVFQKLGKHGLPAGVRFLIPALECGARWHF